MNIKQVLQIFLILIFLIFIAWLAFYFLIAALIIGACAAAFVFVKRFLEDKGIIKKTAPDISSSSDETADETVEIIEVEYSEVKDDKSE